MARPVLDEGYQGIARSRPVAELAVHEVADEIDDIDVLPLVVAADIVDPAGPALFQDGFHGQGMVLDVQPVPYVQSVPVNGKRSAVEYVVDHQRDELLGKLVWPVVVRASCGQGGEAI